MSKADTLGTSPAFNGAAGARSARRAATESVFGPSQPQPVTEVSVGDISLNPSNPRSELGDLTQLSGSLRDHGQKTAISIMSRDAYLAAHPDHASELEPGTQYVAVDGNSRLAAAREAGLRTVKVMVDDDLGKNADDLLESSLVANIHRRDLDHLDEARALQRLLAIHGTQEALAERLHRSQGWVSQRLALLNLTPELQQRLEEGKESAALLRRVGNKKPEDQEAHLEKLKKGQQAKAARVKSVQKEPTLSGAPEGKLVQEGSHYGVIKPTPPEAQEHPVEEPEPELEPSPTQSPEPTSKQPADAPVPVPQARKEVVDTMPWDDIEALADVIFDRLSWHDRINLTMLMQQRNREAAGVPSNS